MRTYYQWEVHIDTHCTYVHTFLIRFPTKHLHAIAMFSLADSWRSFKSIITSGQVQVGTFRANWAPSYPRASPSRFEDHVYPKGCLEGSLSDHRQPFPKRKIALVLSLLFSTIVHSLFDPQLASISTKSWAAGGMNVNPFNGFCPVWPSVHWLMNFPKALYPMGSLKSNGWLSLSSNICYIPKIDSQMPWKCFKRPMRIWRRWGRRLLDFKLIKVKDFS